MLMINETYHCFLTSRSRLLFGLNVSTDKFSINVINRLFLGRLVNLKRKKSNIIHLESSQVIISFSIASRCHLLCIPGLCEYKWGSSENETEKTLFSSVKSFGLGILG